MRDKYAVIDAHRPTYSVQLMCDALDGLVAHAPRRFVVTTDSAHAEPIARNWLRRCFDVEARATLGGTNHVWASDITYIPTHQGFLYLAVVLDLASRRVIG